MSVSDGAPLEVAKAASLSARTLAMLSGQARNDALTAIHTALAAAKEPILAANARDMVAAEALAADGKLSSSVVSRLDLGKGDKWNRMLQGVLDVRDLEDPAIRSLTSPCISLDGNVHAGESSSGDASPWAIHTSRLVGKVTLSTRLDDGCYLERVTAPIGVLLTIFEARPEVLANIASLAIKSGNATILKGGKESTNSFIEIANVISDALSKTEVPNAAVQLLKFRDNIPELLALDKYIDLVIPRGSNALVTYIKNNTKIPVLGHADGLCSVYLHSDADKDMAVKIILDAKLGYTAACNAVETLLVHEEALTSVLPAVATALLSRGVSLRCDQQSKAALTQTLDRADTVILQDATEEDYCTEFLDLVIAIKTVPRSTSPEAAVDLAVAHINSHSSKHTDSIVTSNESLAKRFQLGVDSACVFWNVSTRFSDGMRFGFGTEVGVSTNKIHARGPVGLEGIMIYKYLINGSGQTASEYHEGEGGKQFKHEPLPLR